MADQVIYIPVILKQLASKSTISSTDIIALSDAAGNILYKCSIQELVQNSGVSFSGNVAGIAKTDSTPAAGATPESQVIYIAGSGTFSNFPGADSNPIVLTENLNVISWDGTKATVQEVPVDVDTSNLIAKDEIVNDLITGGTDKPISAEQAKILDNYLKQVTSQHVSANLLLPEYIVPDRFWDANSIGPKENSASSLYCYYIPVEYGKQYVLTGWLGGSFHGGGWLKADGTKNGTSNAEVIENLMARRFNPKIDDATLVINAYKNGSEAPTLMLVEGSSSQPYEAPGVILELQAAKLDTPVPSEAEMQAIASSSIATETPIILRQKVAFSGILDACNGFTPVTFGREVLSDFSYLYNNPTKDVTIGLWGSSLTASVLYARGRSDAHRRPPMFQSYTWGSKIAARLIPDLQTYSRYDDPGVFTETGNWTTDSAQSNWDDNTARTGLTRFTSDAGATLSWSIPTKMWRANLIIRTEDTGDACTITIAEGNGKVQIYDETTETWVEANGYVVSMAEAPATLTKGNTTYQKRLDMRCANLSGSTYTFDSRATAKTVTMTKSSDTSKRMLYWGLEMSPKPYVVKVINAARGGHAIRTPDQATSLISFMDNELVGFKPDLLLVENTLVNIIYNTLFTAGDLGFDREGAYQIIYRYLFDTNEANSLASRFDNFSTTKMIMFTPTCASGNGIHNASTGKLVAARSWVGADNGLPMTAFDYFNFVNAKFTQLQIQNKNFCYIPLWKEYKELAEKQFGQPGQDSDIAFWLSAQPSGVDGNGLGSPDPITGISVQGTVPAFASWQKDLTHMNEIGQTVWDYLIVPAFAGL